MPGSRGADRGEPTASEDDTRGRAFGVVAAEIRRTGPLAFSRYLELALYDPKVGFYEAGGRAGRRGGDFLTSPEVGPLFGAVIARALDGWWQDLGRPDPFVVVDAGAGPGTLGVSLRHAAPRCAPALRYVLVERSRAQRALHGEHLSLCAPETSRSGSGPEFVSLAELPTGPFAGVVLANELLDNLPFDLAARSEAGWDAIHVGLEDDASDSGAVERGRTGSGDGGSDRDGLEQDGARLVEVAIPADEARSALLDRLAPRAPVGARVPVQSAASAWLRTALDLVRPGRVAVIDYADVTASMAARGTEWLRTYASHGRGGGALDRPGDQDVTAEVARDQLARVQAPDRVLTQADFLAAHGIDELVGEGRRTWNERAAIGDLAAIRGRSRITEAEALCDPAGLGAFQVLEWSLTAAGGE